jgi:exodeoxyribonuclease VII small subunit
MSNEAATNAASPPISFEESTRRLTAIVEQLESGELPLERSLELFEEGIRVARTAKARLDKAEQRVEELLRIEPDGKPVVRNFEG